MLLTSPTSLLPPCALWCLWCPGECWACWCRKLSEQPRTRMWTRGTSAHVHTHSHSERRGLGLYDLAAASAGYIMSWILLIENGILTHTHHSQHTNTASRRIKSTFTEATSPTTRNFKAITAKPNIIAYSVSHPITGLRPRLKQ